jgi:hypothetical protein
MSTSRSDATVRRESWQQPGLQAPCTRPHPTLPPSSRAVSHRLSLRHRALEHQAVTLGLKSRIAPSTLPESGKARLAHTRKKILPDTR